MSEEEQRHLPTLYTYTTHSMNGGILWFHPSPMQKNFTKIIFLPFKPSYIFELALDLTYREKKMIPKMYLKEL